MRAERRRLAVDQNRPVRVPRRHGASVARWRRTPAGRSSGVAPRCSCAPRPSRMRS
jgi:hypothetical protein